MSFWKKLFSVPKDAPPSKAAIGQPSISPTSISASSTVLVLDSLSAPIAVEALVSALEDANLTLRNRAASTLSGLKSLAQCPGIVAVLLDGAGKKKFDAPVAFIRFLIGQEEATD